MMPTVAKIYLLCQCVFKLGSTSFRANENTNSEGRTSLRPPWETIYAHGRNELRPYESPGRMENQKEIQD